MGFNIFFYRINKFIWGMSLADRPIICKKLQFLMANIVLSLWIQDSRLRKKLLQSNFFGLKIQGWRPSDSRSFFGSWILNLESCLLGLQKLFWDLESWILPPWVHFFFEILNLELWILPPWVHFFLRSWILNFESCLLGFKKFLWDLESWILSPMYFGKGGMGTSLHKIAIFDHQNMP